MISYVILSLTKNPPSLSSLQSCHCERTQCAWQSLAFNPHDFNPPIVIPTLPLSFRPQGEIFMTCNFDIVSRCGRNQRRFVTRSTGNRQKVESYRETITTPAAARTMSEWYGLRGEQETAISLIAHSDSVKDSLFII